MDVHAVVARWRHPMAARPGRRFDDGRWLLSDPPDAIARRRRARSRVGRGSGTIGRRRPMAARRHAPAGWRDRAHHCSDVVAPAAGARRTSDVRARRDPRAQSVCAAHVPSNGRARTGQSQDGTLHSHADVRVPAARVRRCSTARRADPDGTRRLDRDDAGDRRLLPRRGYGGSGSRPSRRELDVLVDDEQPEVRVARHVAFDAAPAAEVLDEADRRRRRV